MRSPDPSASPPLTKAAAGAFLSTRLNATVDEGGHVVVLPPEGV